MCLFNTSAYVPLWMNISLLLCISTVYYLAFFIYFTIPNSNHTLITDLHLKMWSVWGYGAPCWVVFLYCLKYTRIFVNPHKKKWCSMYLSYQLFLFFFFLSHQKRRPLQRLWSLSILCAKCLQLLKRKRGRWKIDYICSAWSFCEIFLSFSGEI